MQLKIWKIIKLSIGVIAYVKVPESSNIFDTSYAALQLVRKKMNDDCISGTQLLDYKEKMLEGIPVYTL